MMLMQNLLRVRAILNADLHNASTYVTSLLPLSLNGDVEAVWRFIPSAQLGGDTFGYYWLDGENFALYLLDVCGNRFRISLIMISISNIIHSRL